jgi:hypothetical protein
VSPHNFRTVFSWTKLRRARCNPPSADGAAYKVWGPNPSGAQVVIGVVWRGGSGLWYCEPEPETAVIFSSDGGGGHRTREDAAGFLAARVRSSRHRP